MTTEIDKKGINWFKGVLSNQNQLEKNKQENDEKIVETSSPVTEKSEPPSQNDSNPLFSRDNQDKIALDAFVAIENLLKDRQLLTYKNHGLEDQLNAANEMIHRFKHDQIKKEQLIQEKNKDIRELETNLTNKQMSYDQLLEDYKAYQLYSNIEYEKISSQLQTETIKYNKLHEESTNNQYNSMLKISELDETIRNLEIENQKYLEQYQTIMREKAELMKTINDFTDRMSFSLLTKTTSNPESTE